MEKETARKVVKLNLESIANLNMSLRIVKKDCSREIFEFYRRGVANAIAAISLDLLEPIYMKFPDLKDY